MIWKWFVMFGLGTLFGVCISWFRRSVMYRRIASAPAPPLAHRASSKGPLAERSTMRVKIGVIPFEERPTIVHDSALLPDMIPCGPPESAVCGTIELVEVIDLADSRRIESRQKASQAR